MILRVIYGAVLIILAFTAPWWISAILALVGLLYFEKLYEAIAVGVIIDSLYGSGATIFGFSFVFTAFFLIAFFAVSTFRKRLLI